MDNATALKTATDALELLHEAHDKMLDLLLDDRITADALYVIKEVCKQLDNCIEKAAPQYELITWELMQSKWNEKKED